MGSEPGGFDKNLLYSRIASKGMTVSNFAKAIGMNPSTFYRKTSSNGSKFSVGEVKLIASKLGLSNKDACNIFLNGNLH